MNQKATLFFVAVMTTACASKEEPAFKTSTGPTFQTEIFDRSSASSLFRSTQKTLEAEGYALTDVNPSLGYLSATRFFEADTYFSDQPFGTPPPSFIGSDRALVEVNAHIVQMNNESKLRLSLTQKAVNKAGEVIAAEPIALQGAYDKLFSQIKSIEMSLSTRPKPARKQK